MRALILVCALGGVAAADPPRGVAVGAEAGQPTAGTIGWSQGMVGAEAAVGTGVEHGHGLYLALDVTAAPVVVMKRIPIYVGVGVRRYDDHFDAMSLDEIPDVHV